MTRPSSPRWLAAVGAVVVGGACAGTTPPPIPRLQPTDTATVALDPAFAALFDEIFDEDREALDALQALPYTSLAKNGDHVSGVVLAPDTAFGASRPHGGASAAGRYDFDVESFAYRQRVQRSLRFFQGPSRDRFRIWLGRMNRYEGMIRDVLSRYGVPGDMVYLALIESGYSPTAVSWARAVGMWQFMARTARAYGLRVDSLVDERRDPFKATDAAARHLADLQTQFGSWYLAAAAYNAGARRVSRGIARLPEDEVSDETFFDLSAKRLLRPETRDYVPKLIAATMIAEDPGGYGFDEIDPLDPLVFDEVTVPDQTGLDVIAGLADTTVAAVWELNPHFVLALTPPGEVAIVRVPQGRGTQAAQRLARLPADERVHFRYHAVRRGETMALIANRYGVDLANVRAANPRIRPRRLEIGQQLVIPLSTAARHGAVKPLPPPRPAFRMHRVRRGETLWVLARRYRVRVSDLRRWNGFRSGQSLLRIGQRLRVSR